MRDWRAFVRTAFPGAQLPTEQAIEELAQHVEETYRVARAAGHPEDEALDLARAQLEHPPTTLPPNMIAASRAGFGGFVSNVARDVRYARRVFAARQDSARSRSSRWRSASAPTRRSSALSTR